MSQTCPSPSRSRQPSIFFGSTYSALPLGDSSRYCHWMKTAIGWRKVSVRGLCASVSPPSSHFHSDAAHAELLPFSANGGRLFRGTCASARAPRCGAGESHMGGSSGALIRSASHEFSAGRPCEPTGPGIAGPMAGSGTHHPWPQK